MNLADMLCYADIHQLRRIAENYECDCSAHSKHELIQSILSKVHRKEVTEQMMAELQVEDLRFLSSFLFDKKEAFSPEELTARARRSYEDHEQKAGEKNSRRLISEYRARGWLFNGVSGKDRYLLQFPNDLKRRFSDLLLSRFAQSLEVTTEPRWYRDELNLICEDTVRFLDFVAREEVPLTTSGFLYKRQLQSLLTSFSVSETLPEPAAWRFGYGRKFKEYPLRFSFVYDACYYHGWIAETNDRLALTDSGQSVLDGHSVPAISDMYRFWLRLYKGPIHNLPTIAHWIDGLAKQWVTVRSLHSILLPFVKPYYYDTSADVLDKRIIPMMTHLGLIALGVDDDAGPVIRILDEGSAVIKGIHVEDDDKIELPPNG